MKTFFNKFWDKYLTRNQSERHATDVVRYVVACYDYHCVWRSVSVTAAHGGVVAGGSGVSKDVKGVKIRGKAKVHNVPDFHGDFVFHLLRFIALRTWKDEHRTRIYESLLFDVLYSSPNTIRALMTPRAHAFACAGMCICTSLSVCLSVCLCLHFVCVCVCPCVTMGVLYRSLIVCVK